MFSSADLNALKKIPAPDMAALNYIPEQVLLNPNDDMTNTYTPGTFLQYSKNNIYIWLPSQQGHFIINDDTATDIDPNWRSKIVLKTDLDRPTKIDLFSYVVQHLSLMQPSGISTPITLNSSKTIYGVKNGIARPYLNPAMFATWPEHKTPPYNSTSIAFTGYINENKPLLWNPARMPTSDPNHTLWRFESPNNFESKITTNFIPYSEGQDVYKFGQLSSFNGQPTEDFYIEFTDSTRTNIRYTYLIAQFTDVLQIESFKLKFSSGSYDNLMSMLAVQNLTATNCKATINGPCSRLFGLDGVSMAVQAWLTETSTGMQNAVFANICSNSNLSECDCVNRSTDSEYNLLAGKMQMPDSCWYLPCKDITKNNIPPNLLNPICPDVCQILNNFTNVGSVSMNNNTSILTCNKTTITAPTSSSGLPESSSGLPEPPQFSSGLPEPPQFSSGLPEPPQSSLPATRGIILIFVLSVCLIFIVSVIGWLIYKKTSIFSQN